MHKNKFKIIKDWNVKPETIKLLEENIGSILYGIGLINTSLDVSSGKENKNKNKKMGLSKWKSFCTSKETISKMKRLPTEWEMIFANDTSNKVLIFKVYKQLIQLNMKK